MTDSKMYDKRRGNIPAFRGCGFGCVYCEKTFKRLVMMNNACPKCATFEPHFHPEALLKTPPKTKDGEFLTVGLSGDVSFMNLDQFGEVLLYCMKWNDRTFLVQSKNPKYFLRFKIPDNVIISTTIETNRQHVGYDTNTEYSWYDEISKAPIPVYRWNAMLNLNCRKAVTIEPILDFDLDILLNWIKDIAPEFCYIGYANDGKQGKRLKLPEPPLAKTLELIARLREVGIDVREKTIRKSWWEV